VLDITKTEGEQKLLELADLVERATRYDQQIYVHACGSPACALGHWAAAHPERWGTVEVEEGFNSIHRYPMLIRFISRARSSNPFDSGGPVSFTRESAILEFGLRPYEFDRLFGGVGCGNALMDAQKAAKFLREYVHQRATLRVAGV
jgi:hypothetical protein